MTVPSIERLLDRLVIELDSVDVAGIALVGSHARDVSTRNSDVDLDIYRASLPDRVEDRYHLRLRNDYLIGITTTTVHIELAKLSHPYDALWAVPALRRQRILLDRRGVLARLQHAAHVWRWEPLQAQANSLASYLFTETAEEAHKLVDGLYAADEGKILYASLGMVKELTKALAVFHGVPIESENRYFELVESAVGPTSVWTGWHRRALGWEKPPSGRAPLVDRGRAALELYRETARLFRLLLTAEHEPVATHTLNLIAAAL